MLTRLALVLDPALQKYYGGLSALHCTALLGRCDADQI